MNLKRLGVIEWLVVALVAVSVFFLITDSSEINFSPAEFLKPNNNFAADSGDPGTVFCDAGDGYLLVGGDWCCKQTGDWEVDGTDPANPGFYGVNGREGKEGPPIGVDCYRRHPESIGHLCGTYQNPKGKFKGVSCGILSPDRDPVPYKRSMEFKCNSCDQETCPGPDLPLVYKQHEQIDDTQCVCRNTANGRGWVEESVCRELVTAGCEDSNMEIDCFECIDQDNFAVYELTRTIPVKEIVYHTFLPPAPPHISSNGLYSACTWDDDPDFRPPIGWYDGEYGRDWSECPLPGGSLNEIPEDEREDIIGEPSDFPECAILPP